MEVLRGKSTASMVRKGIYNAFARLQLAAIFDVGSQVKRQEFLPYSVFTE